jgi:hypothetical protein
MSRKLLRLPKKNRATKGEEKRNAETKIAKDDAEQKKQQLEKQKSEVDSVLNGSMQMLVQGSWQDEEAMNDFVSAVCEHMQTMGCDKVLLASLPKALGCSPGERGTFSKAAVDETMRHLSEKFAKVASDLDIAVEALEDKKAEDLGAWAIADVARDNEQQAAQEKTHAEHASQAAIADGKVDQDKVREAEIELNHVLSKRTLTEAKIADIDMALGEIVRLEGASADVNKENDDNITPAAKKMKLGHGEIELPAEVVLASL